jgi:rRNA biogenesis protein RRP5
MPHECTFSNSSLFWSYADIKTIVKFAQMEFKHGEAERGRTIFEGVMSNYPKRVDLWSIYLDMEIRAAEQDIIR